MYWHGQVVFFDFKDWWRWVGSHKTEILDKTHDYPFASVCLNGLITYYDEDFSPAYGNPGDMIFKCPCLVACYRAMFMREYNTGIKRMISCGSGTTHDALHDILEHERERDVTLWRAYPGFPADPGHTDPVTNIWFMDGVNPLPVYST